MELYMKESLSFKCLAVAMTTPNGTKEQPIKNKHLFWMKPGEDNTYKIHRNFPSQDLSSKVLIKVVSIESFQSGHLVGQEQ
jgi:hypothetical protein